MNFLNGEQGMRDTRFRAWGTAEKKMYRNVFFDNIEVYWFGENGELDDTELLGDRYEKRMLQHCILQQYTGLKDKNGQGIYEGDILKYDEDKCPHCKKLIYDKHDLYVIKWNAEMCQFDCTNEDNYMSPEIWERDMEIIGNIYENPELLEVDK